MSNSEKRRKRRYYHIRKYKVLKGCCDCGYNKDSIALGFSHIDPATKSIELTYSGAGGLVARGGIAPLIRKLSLTDNKSMLCIQSSDWKEEINFAEIYIDNNGFSVGNDIFLCFSPERIDPGNKDFNTSNTPKVIGGITKKCTKIGASIYETIVNKVITVSSTETAEMVKLLENTFRAINIGLANEIAIMCEKLGVNVWEVIDAASTKPFGYMKFSPGPGIGGHCIPIDPHYLSWKLKTLDYDARFIQLAGEINTNMPNHILMVAHMRTLQIQNLNMIPQQH